MYTPGGSAKDPVVNAELLRISQVLNEMYERILPIKYAAPDKPRDGMVVYADGTTWNPGSGEGAYIYYNSAWNFLG
jgi:hypothetical protein